MPADLWPSSAGASPWWGASLASASSPSVKDTSMDTGSENPDRGRVASFLFFRSWLSRKILPVRSGSLLGLNLPLRHAPTGHKAHRLCTADGLQT